MSIEENILLCVDVDEEMGESLAPPGQVGMSRMFHMRRALFQFLEAKEKMSKNHRFALGICRNEVDWVLGFSPNTKQLRDMVDQLAPEKRFERFELDSLISSLERYKEENNSIRIIFWYGRSSVVPFLSHEGHQRWEQLVASADFELTLDVMYLHEKESTEHFPQRVFDLFQSMETKHSYLFENYRSVGRLYVESSLLLGNPLQRLEQYMAKNVLLPKGKAKFVPQRRSPSPEEELLIDL